MWEGKYRQMKIHNVKSKWNKKGVFMKALKNRWETVLVFLLLLSAILCLGNANPDNSSISNFPESKNVFIGEYKSLNRNSLIISNSKIDVDMDRFFYWDGDLRISPKTSEVFYDFDALKNNTREINVNQDLEFAVETKDDNGKFYIVNTMTCPGTFNFMKAGSKYIASQTFVYNGKNKLISESFVKVDSKVAINFVGEWSLVNPTEDVDTAIFSVDEKGNFKLTLDNNDSVEGSFDVKKANKENSFTAGYIEGLIAYDGTLYLGFAIDGHVANGFFAKK